MHRPKVGTNNQESGIIIGDGPWVYFLQDGLEMYSPIKIGHTGRTPLNGNFERVSEIKSHSPRHLLAALPGGEITEKELHKLFDKDRMNGEWFRQTSDLLYMIHLMIQEAGIRRIRYGQYICIKMMERTVDYWYRKRRDKYDEIVYDEDACRAVLNISSMEEKDYGKNENDPFFLTDLFYEIYEDQSLKLEQAFWEPEENA